MKIEKGYLVNLFQCARQYRYNGRQCRTYFNSIVGAQADKKRALQDEYLTFGEFDLLEIIPVDSLWGYHKVQGLAKKWLGKRQSVLLYEISECKETSGNAKDSDAAADAGASGKARLRFDKDSKRWSVEIDGKVVDKRFLCLTMLSLTNEIIEKTDDVLKLQGMLRKQILSIVDEINRAGARSRGGKQAAETAISGTPDANGEHSESADNNESGKNGENGKTKGYDGEVYCEVFGTLNAAELAIIWLSDQYVDILQTVDYVKHMKVAETTGGNPGTDHANGTEHTNDAKCANGTEHADDAEHANGAEHANDTNGEEVQPAFFTSFSIIATRQPIARDDQTGANSANENSASTATNAANEIRGDALVQIAVQDFVRDHGELRAIVREIVGMGDGSCPSDAGGHAQGENGVASVKPDPDAVGSVRFSVGEYDAVMQIPASRAIELIVGGKAQSAKPHARIGLCLDENGKYLDEDRKILVSNIRLLYSESQTSDLKALLDGLDAGGQFQVRWGTEFQKFAHAFELSELQGAPGTGSGSAQVASNGAPGDAQDAANAPGAGNGNAQNASSGAPQNAAGAPEKSNEAIYEAVRAKLEQLASPAAGIVNTLDLMYMDYSSVISTSYSALWVSDLHRQFKAVLLAIGQLLHLGDGCIEWSWEWYLDLTNAFKQQIYHLAQSSRMFFEIPSCHLRATGQYDFLMHAYYGITKKILEVIYRTQGDARQSELVPLITVNTVPQVKTQMYFEAGEGRIRTINLDIPNSIIFDIQRGVWYLAHELFHYAAPWNRGERNYYMGRFLLESVFERQFLYVLQGMLSQGADGTADAAMEKMVRSMFFESSGDGWAEKTAIFYKKLRTKIRSIVKDNFASEIRPFLCCEDGDLSSAYQLAVFQFADGPDSQEFYEKLFLSLLPLCKEFLEDPGPADKSPDMVLRMRERIRFCLKNTGEREYVRRFIRTSDGRRHLDHGLRKHTLVVSSEWENIREACSDIAMASLNGMTLVDYMLFCVQAWTDSIMGTDVPERMRESTRELEEPRFGLVADYFYQDNREGWRWEAYEKWECGRLAPATKEEFRERFVWFYVSHAAGEDWADDGRVRKELDRLEDLAGKWLAFFARAIVSYQKDLSFHYETLLPILEDFDLRRRCGNLDNDARFADKSKAEEICAIFQNQVRENYAKMLRGTPEHFCRMTRTRACWGSVAGIRREHARKRFQFDIETAHLFYNQKSLKELGTLNAEIHDKVGTRQPAKPYIWLGCLAYPATGDTDGDRWEIHAYGMSELFFYIRHCARLLEQRAKDMGQGDQGRMSPVWFRGGGRASHLHIPTLMHAYTGDVAKKYPSLQANQRDYYGEFKFQADGVAEMERGLAFTTSDYISMMRHYRVPTSFLDWSETAFSSLYFALSKYWESKPRKPIDHDISLSIFHPGIYNQVRLERLSRLRGWRELVDNGGRYANLPDTIKKVLGEEYFYKTPIPNLSTAENERMYDMFLLGDSKLDAFFAKKQGAPYEQYRDTCKTDRSDRSDMPDMPDIRDLFLPMAILTSRLNHRIRVQRGCFVAYNLYTPPNPDAPHNPFDYVSLEEIQKRVLKKGSAGTMGTSPIFLYKLIIDKNCVEELGWWLQSMGISRASVYPELPEKLAKLTGVA